MPKETGFKSHSSLTPIDEKSRSALALLILDSLINIQNDLLCDNS
jgi:hypothetical protein